MKTPFLILALAHALLPPTAGHAEVRPANVIFVLTDDLGYSEVGCYGATKVKTPEIDRLAAEGLRFTDFHTADSICSPSRAAFLTGAYPRRADLYIKPVSWIFGRLRGHTYFNMQTTSDSKAVRTIV